MRRILNIVVVTILINSCVNIESKNKPDEAIINGNIKKEIIDNNGPINLVLDLADTLDKLGWINDTGYIGKKHAYSLNNNDLIYFDDKPFYRREIAEHEIYMWESTSNTIAKQLDFEVLEKVENIWLYYYHQDTIDTYIPDGLIEQWTFSNRIDAKNAYDNLNLVYPIPYFNTQPFYYLYKNYLIILSTRAMMYSYYQKVHYDLLKK